ncbi:hypothetical protein AAG570_007410 [Ranatra chinensis]|uniref:Uncharacterized protein n=1 Tax=Ranatra chinensis TaxID=642074 RepID=A0ABD0XXN1_9HEMI
MGSVEKTREWSTHGQQGGVSADAIASHMRAFEGKLCRSVTRVLVGARPNVGQMEVPGSNVKGTAPKAQRKSAPTNDGSSSASPKPKKSGQKVCSQQASQRKSDELRPKNRKDFTFGDRKAEEIRIRNKELRERLNRIKQRKPPSYKQNQVEIADFPPDDDTNGVEVDQISPTADGGCPLSRTEEDSIGGSRSLRDEKEHEGEANTRPEHEGTSSSNPKVDGTNLHTPPASQHGEKMELPNGNKNNSSSRTLDELFAKVNDVEGKLGTLLGNRRHFKIENQVEIIPAALPPNGVSTGVDFNKIAPAVNSVCPQCRTIEQNMFSEGRSLGKEKEHEGEATRANSSPEYQGKTLPKPSYYQIDGSSSAPPHHTGIGPNTYASPAPQCRKEEELPISENSILSYIVSAVDEFDSKYKYWSDQVREGKTLSNTQNESQYIQRLTAEADQIYSRPLASGPTGVSKGVGLNMITPTPDNVCSLLRAGYQDLFGKSQSLRKEEHEGGAKGAYGSPQYQARTLLEPVNTQNGSSSSAPPYHTKVSEEELLPNENSIWIYIIKGFNGCKAFYRYCKEVWNKAREIIHPLINTGVRTLLGPSNPHYDGNSSAPPDRRMKFCGEDLPPNEKLILTSIITAFDDCNAKYRYCSELLDKVQEIIPILNTEVESTTESQGDISNRLPVFAAEDIPPRESGIPPAPPAGRDLSRSPLLQLFPDSFLDCLEI